MGKTVEAPRGAELGSAEHERSRVCEALMGHGCRPL